MNVARERFHYSRNRENYRIWSTEIPWHLRVSFTVAAMHLRTCERAHLPSKKYNYTIHHAYLQSIYTMTNVQHLNIKWETVAHHKQYLTRVHSPLSWCTGNKYIK